MIIKLLYSIQLIESVFKIMSIKINYLKKLSNKTPANVVLFVDEKFNIGNLKKYISNSEFSYINDLLKNSDLRKNQLYFEINSKKSKFFFKSLVFNKSFM